MVVQGVKPFIEGLLALIAEISLATVRSFPVFMRTGMTTESTFHRACWRVDVSLLYLTHHDLMHYPHHDLMHYPLLCERRFSKLSVN